MPQPATQQDTAFADLFLSHFIPSVFIGAVLLDFIEEGAHPLIRDIVTNTSLFSYLIVATLNGVATAAIAFLIQLERARRYNKRHKYFFSKPLDRRERLKVSIITFLSGFSITSLYLSAWGLPMIVLIMAVVFIHLKEFAQRITRMLRPGRAISWQDAGYLIRIYITMLTAFTMLNLTAQLISAKIPGVPPAFNAFNGNHVILNAVYFSVSMMTTVGFGDIHAVSPLGKAFVAFECLTSYFMFALIIGAITRGIAQTPSQPPPPPNKTKTSTGNTPNTPGSPSDP